MNSSHVQVMRDNAAWRCFRTTDGRDRLLVGCAHIAPRSAITHSSALTERFRGSDDATPRSAVDEDTASSGSGRRRLSGVPQRAAGLDADVVASGAPPVADAGQGFGSAGVHPLDGFGF